MIKTARHGATLQVPCLNVEHVLFWLPFSIASLQPYCEWRDHPCASLVSDSEKGYKMMWSYCRECGSQQARSTKLTGFRRSPLLAALQRQVRPQLFRAGCVGVRPHHLCSSTAGC